MLSASSTVFWRELLVIVSHLLSWSSTVWSCELALFLALSLMCFGISNGESSSSSVPESLFANVVCQIWTFLHILIFLI